VSDYDQYRASINLLPDEAAKALTGSLLDDGFCSTELEGGGALLQFGPDYDPIDQIEIRRLEDSSVRLRIRRFGWRFEDERFGEPHEAALEFTPVEDNCSRVVATGWIRETMDDYLLRLGADLRDQTVVGSYSYSYRGYVDSFVSTLR
jgi:hypothetical protein